MYLFSLAPSISSSVQLLLHSMIFSFILELVCTTLIQFEVTSKSPSLFILHFHVFFHSLNFLVAAPALIHFSVSLAWKSFSIFSSLRIEVICSSSSKFSSTASLSRTHLRSPVLHGTWSPELAHVLLPGLPNYWERIDCLPVPFNDDD